MQKVFSILTLTILMFITSCSSNKKGNQFYNRDPSKLEIQGDSDTGHAGGLQSVFFEFNSSNLSMKSQEMLKQNANFLINNNSIEIQIEGHCDERGGQQFNLALGEKRSLMIKDYLVALGVSSERISIISYGKERSIAFGHEESAWAQNRRGNFVIIAK